MLKFLIDEDIPRSTAKVLRDRGYKVLDVRDCRLRGEADEELADIQELLLLISLMKYPLQS